MRKAKSAVVALVLALIMAVPAAAIAQPAVDVADSTQSLAIAATQQSPEEMGLIPIRQFFVEELGAEVEWIPQYRAILINFEGGTIVLFVDEAIAYTNDVPLILGDGVIMVQNRAFLTMDDLILLSDAFDATHSPFEMITLELPPEARDIALADFDYLVSFTLANSVWDNVIYRRLGVDFEAHVAVHRESIENMVPITVPHIPQHIPIRDCDEPLSVAANYLVSLLAFSFEGPFQGIGHLGIRELTMYRALLTITQRGYHSEHATEYARAQARTAFGAYISPQAIWFYGEYEFDLDGTEGGWPEIPGNIVTEILVTDQVAYLQIQSFLGCREFDNLTTVPFLHEIQDFDHLILDIRGNMGGAMDYFASAFFIPLAREAAPISSYQFFTGGEGATALMDAYLQLFLSLGIDEAAFYAAIHPVSDVVSQRELALINPNDYERLSYVLVTREFFDPANLPAEMRIPFEGKIWLLVDEMSMSASVGAAMLSISSGFATVVGDNTSGIMAAYHMYIALPNTGIIWRVDIGMFTDDYGRSIEELGLAPHIRNLPGMDALETVLELIAQGEY